MKRSEMLEKISDKLLLISPLAITVEEAQTMAAQLLNLLEDEGMQPPKSLLPGHQLHPKPFLQHRWEE